MFYFITFGAGGQNYYDAGNRLISQANNLQLFDKLIFYTDEHLKNDKEFWNQHYRFIENNTRGYGYWLWKSYIIKKTMETMKNDDVLLYLDCGCEIDINKKEVIRDYLEYVKKEYVISTHTHIEREWTKMDLIKKLDMLDDKYLNTQQHEAGVIFFFVCDETKNLINKWYDLACEYDNINDRPSLYKNLDCFQEHRHDQSIFSLLTKKYNLHSKNYSAHSCINYIRNKSGNSRL
jgi:hypothetical protein